MGNYNNREDLPVLDKFDPNPNKGQSKRYLSETPFDIARLIQDITKIPQDYYVIAETRIGQDGKPMVKPGSILLEGTFESE
jgi:hypothetical protein